MNLEVIQEEKIEMVVPRKIGGWLIVVALGIFISPARILYSLITVFPPAFSKDTWYAVTNPAGEAYSPFWAPVLIGECAFNLILLAASLFMVRTLIGKKAIFPKVYAGVAIASAIFIPIDAYIITFVAPDAHMFDADTANDFASALFSCLIWVPYLFISQRSKETFIK